MRRADTIPLILDAHPEPRVAIGGVGASSNVLHSIRHSAGHLYNMDFAYPAAVGLGIALARPELSVITLEGDGSAIAGAGTYCTIAAHRPANLTTVVFDNGVYGTGTGRIATPTGRGVRIEDLAKACGMPAVTTMRIGDIQQLAGIAPRLAGDGPWLLVIEIDPSDAQSGSRRPMRVDFTQNGVVFQQHLRELTDSTGPARAAEERL